MPKKSAEIDIYDERFNYFQDIYFSRPTKFTSEEIAYRLIIKAIKEEYMPGDILQERTLAEKFSMSRTPITIALNRLISEGVLKKMPKKGCIIPNLVKSDAQNAFYARVLLESEACKKIAENHTDKVIEVLQDILLKTEEAVKEKHFVNYSFYDERFHYAIMFFYGNEYIYEAWKRIYLRCNLYTRQFDRYFATNDIIHGNTLKAHKEIFDAIKNHDSSKVAKLIENHILDALNKIF